MMMNVVKPLVMILVFVCSTLLAKEKSAWVPDHFEASFVKISTNFFTKETVKDRGTLYYQYPKRLRLELEGKDKIIYVTNPREVFYYRGPTLKGTPGELTISRSRGTDVSQLFDTLRSYGLVSNKDYEVTKKNRDVEIKFSSTMAKKLKIVKAKLSFSNKDYSFKSLTTLIVTLDNESKLHYDQLKIKTKSKFKRSLFTFDPPPNTNVSRQN